MKSWLRFSEGSARFFLLAVLFLAPFSALLANLARLMLAQNNLLPWFLAWKEILLILSFLFWFSGFVFTRKKIAFGGLLDFLMTAYFLLALVSFLFGAKDWSRLLWGIRFDLLFFMIYFLTKQLFSGLSRKVLIVFLFIWSVIAVLGLIQAFFLPPEFLKNLGYRGEVATWEPGKATPMAHLIGGKLLREMSTFSGPNQFSTYLLVALPIVMILLFHKALKFKQAVLIFLLTLLLTFSLIQTFSRSAWLGFLAFIVVLLVLVRRKCNILKKERLIFVLALLALSSCLLLGYDFWKLGQNQNTEFLLRSLVLHQGSTWEHFSANANSIKLILAHPWGLGIGSSGNASQWTRQESIVSENYYLQVAIAYGWLGLLLFLAIVFVLARKLWQNREDFLAVGLFGGLISLSVASLFLHVWGDVATSWAFFALAGIALKSSGTKILSRHDKFGSQSKVALVHDFLNQFGGAERVLLELCKIFPNAPVFTLLYDEEKLGRYFPKDRVRTSFLQKLPNFLKKKHRLLLPFYPVAVEQFDLRDYDLVISSSGAFSKNVIVRSHACHISYIHSPMRYAWDWTHQYLNSKSLKTFAARLILSWLRVWDWSGKDRVDIFLANSHHTKKRIAKYYRKEAVVVYPPVDTHFFKVKNNASRSFFLVVSRLSAYKNIDLVVSLFNKIRLPLVIAGTGAELQNLIKLNQSPETKFVGKVSDEDLRSLYQHARALIFPGEEDFGMVPVEAMACGTPIIGLGIGGVRETVTKDTGVLFSNPSEYDLLRAIRTFIENEKRFDPEKIRRQAVKFSQETFRRAFCLTLQQIGFKE